MTKEQAIDGLKENLCSLCAYGSQNMDSCDIRECDNRDYIKALEQQPSDDCVSIAELEKWLDLNFSFGGACRKLELFDRLEKELPKVTPTQSWVPVSERLPEEGETVLVCYQTQGGVAQSVCEWFDMPNRGIVWSTLCGRNPIAWQPLPKPYEEKRGSEMVERTI